MRTKLRLAAAALAAGLVLPAAAMGGVDGEMPDSSEVHGVGEPGGDRQGPGFGLRHKAGMLRQMLKEGGGPGGILRRYPEAREALRENIEAAVKVRRLAGEYQKAEGKKKEEVKKSLRLALAEQFEARVKGHETRIAVMQKEAERLKERLSKRRGLKDKLVEKRLADLISEEERWEW